MSKAVCVLAHWEADDYLRNGRIPDCTRHMHIKFAEAYGMTIGVGTHRRPTTLIRETAPGALACWLQPVAEWVGRGERRITMITGFDYTPKKTAHGHVVLNRIEL